MSKTIYDFTVKDIQGNDYPLSNLKGKVVLIVNVASKCGFTPQYKGLQAIYDKYKDQGFVILGFPCNQFGGQEPGTNGEIVEFCSKSFQVTFPLMDKIEVNGDKAHPLYEFLKGSISGMLGLKRIKWNFEKFLIDKNGVPKERFWSATSPESLGSSIEKLLKE